MSYALDRAIESGIDSARHYRKDGDAPYQNEHPLFMAWFEAVVLKIDCPDWSDYNIKREVYKRYKGKTMSRGG